MATAKKPNKTQQVREYIEGNPSAKAREIADALKVAPQYVHQVIYKIRKGAAPKQAPIVNTQRQKQKQRMQSSAPTPVPEPKVEAEVEVKVDLVNQPPHYKAGGLETIDFIEAKALDYHLGNVVKYIARAEHKGNKLEDLKKAQWYLSRAVMANEKAIQT